jgi:hypothetical protein
MDYADTNSPSFKLRFYRVVEPAMTIEPLLISNARRLGDGQFRFNIVGAINQVVRIEATTNQTLTSWNTLATITNASGTNLYTDSAAPGFGRRFYRAVSP